MSLTWNKSVSVSGVSISPHKLSGYGSSHTKKRSRRIFVAVFSFSVELLAHLPFLGCAPPSCFFKILLLSRYRHIPQKHNKCPPTRIPNSSSLQAVCKDILRPPPPVLEIQNSTEPQLIQVRQLFLTHNTNSPWSLNPNPNCSQQAHPT